jgi:hypothetical protein
VSRRARAARENNWYTEQGDQLSDKDFGRLTKLQGFSGVAQKGWTMLGGEGEIGPRGGAPFESQQSDPLDDLNAGAP